MADLSPPSLSSTPRGGHASTGRIELVTGPMFSGKSTELVRRVRRFQFAHKKCLLIKYERDTRYSSDCVSTHDKVMLPAISCSVLAQAGSLVDDVDVIGVDEGQFFPDLIRFCQENASKNKIVIVAALDGTFAAKPFGGVCDLVPLSSSVGKLTAVCAGCGSAAEFSKRLSADTAVEVIGGSDTYAPMCRGCYYDHPKQVVSSDSEASASAFVHGGRLELVMGPMFSGKSTELLRRIRLLRFAKKSCLLIKYKRDTRYSDDCVSTHDKVMGKAVSCDTLAQVAELTAKFDVIGVDEGQFFPDLIEFCNLMANQGKTVIVAALDGTFEAQPFGDVCQMIPYCTRVHKLAAVCASCGCDGGFSKRLSHDMAVEVIGGAETYAPMCRSCFYGGAARNPLPLPALVAPTPQAMRRRSSSPASPPSPHAPSPADDLGSVKKRLFVDNTEDEAKTQAVEVEAATPAKSRLHRGGEVLVLRMAVVLLLAFIMLHWVAGPAASSVAC